VAKYGAVAVQFSKVNGQSSNLLMLWLSLLSSSALGKQLIGGMRKLIGPGPLISVHQLVSCSLLMCFYFVECCSMFMLLWPNLRHLGESRGGAKRLLEAVSFKKTKGMGRGRVVNTRWEWVLDFGGCNTKTTGGKGSANTRSRQQVGVCRA